MNESEIGGYRAAYGRDETQFPVYVMIVAAIALLVAFVYYGGFLLFAFFAAAAAVAYYNYPLIETGRPRIGANQYGVFIDGFGIIQWRAIDKVELVPIAVRVMTFNELQIGLKQPLQRALVADWRKLPWPRLMMRLPRMRRRGVPLMAYSPIEQARLVDDDRLIAFARKRGATPAQIALA